MNQSPHTPPLPPHVLLPHIRQTKLHHIYCHQTAVSWSELVSAVPAFTSLDPPNWRLLEIIPYITWSERPTRVCVCVCVCV